MKIQKLPIPETYLYQEHVFNTLGIWANLIGQNMQK